MPILPPVDTLIPLMNLILAGLGAALGLLWFTVAIWAARDARARSRAWWRPVLAFLFVLLLPVLGLIIYLLLRPRETLAEKYDRALEQEALLQGIEERPACPGCSRMVDVRWMVCPRCHTRLREPCRACGTPLDLAWDICPYCATLVNRPEAIVAGTHIPGGEELVPAAKGTDADQAQPETVSAEAPGPLASERS